jgi:hypothetical protein
MVQIETQYADRQNPLNNKAFTDCTESGDSFSAGDTIWLAVKNGPRRKSPSPSRPRATARGSRSPGTSSPSRPAARPTLVRSPPTWAGQLPKLRRLDGR